MKCKRVYCTLIDVLSYEVMDVKGAATLFLVLKFFVKAFLGLIYFTEENFSGVLTCFKN